MDNVREEFEKWAGPYGYSLVRSMDDSRYHFSRTKDAEAGWNARQPEIDALKAENKRLRNAAKPVIDYWFEDDASRTNEDDNKAFLELSNACHRPTMKETK